MQEVRTITEWAQTDLLAARRDGHELPWGILERRLTEQLDTVDLTPRPGAVGTEQS